MANRWGYNRNSERLYFGGLQNHCGMWGQPWNQNTLALWKKTYDQPSNILKSRDITLSTNVNLVKSSHVWMWELDHKQSWAPKNWCFWTVVLEKTLESPLDSKETQPVNPKGNQSWIFITRTDAEAEAPILWPPDAKNWLIWKDPDAGKDWGQEEKGTTEDETVGGITDLMDMSLSSSKCWWWTGKPGVLQSTGSQRLRHDWATELNWRLEQ